MKNWITKFKQEITHGDDFIYKTIVLGNNTIDLACNEVLTSTDMIDDFILKAITRLIEQDKLPNIKEELANYLPTHNIKFVKTYQEFVDFIFTGFCLLIINQEVVIAIETKASLDRGISSAEDEVSIYGPKDAFNENFNTNLGLIRRRIKTKDLMCVSKTIGRKTKTKVGILYINDIADESLVNAIVQKIEKIDIDGIIDSGYLRSALEENSNHFFPTILSTERPDRASMSLLEGKVIVLVDMSPYVLILPSFFVDFFHTSDDYYQKPINITFIRIVRLFAFLVAIFLPAYYIAITTFNQEAIPLKLLMSFIAQRETVPFPAIIEALIMSLSFEILRESDTRMPSSMGTAVSILGGLVLGEAAVSAGIMSPIMIIVIAISAISGLVFSSIELISAIRWWRIVLMFFATFLGVYGIFLGGMLLLIKLASINSFGKSYLAPIAPFIPSEQKDAFLKLNDEKVKKRNPLLSKNRIRGKIK